MKKSIRKYLSLILAVVMTVSQLPASVLVAGAAEENVADEMDEAVLEEVIEGEDGFDDGDDLVVSDSYDGAAEDGSDDELSAGELISDTTRTYGLDKDNAIPLMLFERATASILEEGKEATFSFTPDEDGTYAFFSESNSDTYATLYDSEGEYLDDDDEGGSGSNFKLIYELQAGETYYLAARFYYSEPGEFQVAVIPNIENNFYAYVGGTTDTSAEIEVTPGGVTTLEVEVSGEDLSHVTYEWYYYDYNVDDVLIEGATGSSYSIN